MDDSIIQTSTAEPFFVAYLVGLPLWAYFACILCLLTVGLPLWTFFVCILCRPSFVGILCLHTFWAYFVGIFCGPSFVGILCLHTLWASPNTRAIVLETNASHDVCMRTRKCLHILASVRESVCVIGRSFQQAHRPSPCTSLPYFMCLLCALTAFLTNTHPHAPVIPKQMHERRFGRSCVKFVFKS